MRSSGCEYTETYEGLDFTRAERRLIQRLHSPALVQRWLDSLIFNEEVSGPTMRTFRGVVTHRQAHCLEAALAACTILEQHGEAPLVLDIDSKDGLGHVLFLFRRKQKWGAVGRSRVEGLQGRKPVFRCVRDLVYSYFDAFIDDTARISAYGIRDLTELGNKVNWRLSSQNVWAVERFLLQQPYKKLNGSELRYLRCLRRYQRYKACPLNEQPSCFFDKSKWL